MIDRLTCLPLACAVAFAAAVGCHPNPPSSDIGPAVAAMTGLDAGLIEYKVLGEPTDADPAIPDVLGADEAVRLTLAHDPGVQIKLAQVRAALADARQTRLLPNPVLSLIVRLPEGGGKADVEAGLSTDLLALLQSPRRVSAADHRLRAASMSALAAALDVVSDVEGRLVAAQATDAQQAVLRDRHRLIEQLAEIARACLEAGEAARLDVLALDAERAEVEAEQIESEARRVEQRLALARLMGRPSSSTDWTLPPLDAGEPSPTSERTLIERALEQRPDTRSARWELAALGDDAAVARWSWSDGASLGVEAERDGDWAVGPGGSVPLPLFDWGQARRDKADALVVEARHRVTQVCRQAVEEVRQALAARSAAASMLAKVRDELLPLAERAHAQAEAQYRAGEADVASLLQAEQRLLAARSRLVTARENVALATIRLHRAVGGRAIATASPATVPARELTKDSQ